MLLCVVVYDQTTKRSRTTSHKLNEDTHATLNALIAQATASSMADTPMTQEQIAAAAEAARLRAESNARKSRYRKPAGTAAADGSAGAARKRGVKRKQPLPPFTDTEIILSLVPFDGNMTGTFPAHAHSVDDPQQHGSKTTTTHASTTTARYASTGAVLVTSTASTTMTIVPEWYAQQYEAQHKQATQQNAEAVKIEVKSEAVETTTTGTATTTTQPAVEPISLTADEVLDNDMAPVADGTTPSLLPLPPAITAAAFSALVTPARRPAASRSRSGGGGGSSRSRRAKPADGSARTTARSRAAMGDDEFTLPVPKRARKPTVTFDPDSSPPPTAIAPPNAASAAVAIASLPVPMPASPALVASTNMLSRSSAGSDPTLIAAAQTFLASSNAAASTPIAPVLTTTPTMITKLRDTASTASALTYAEQVCVCVHGVVMTHLCVRAQCPLWSSRLSRSERDYIRLGPPPRNARACVSLRS
jgi:hypothetical protein